MRLNNRVGSVNSIQVDEYYSMAIVDQFSILPTFTRSFYARRSQKRKKGSQLKQLSGSVGVKAVRKHIDEIDPRKPLKF